jgi:hypothetical protein
MAEIWKDIEGYEGMYQVSNLGRVKSLERYVKWDNGGRIVNERVLKARYGKNNGYVYAVLAKPDMSGYTSLLVHRLVLNAFNPIDEKLDTMHLDNDRTNNRLDNLKWGTRKENIQQAVREGRTKGFHTNSGKAKYWNYE